MVRIVRTNEVDTREEVAKLFTDVFAVLSQMGTALFDLQTSDCKMPHLGRVVLIHEDGNLYPGVVCKVLPDGLFEVHFLDGDDGCYGVEDLACNVTETKGAEDA